MNEKDIIAILHKALADCKNITALKVYQGGRALQVRIKNEGIINIMAVKIKEKYVILI